MIAKAVVRKPNEIYDQPLVVPVCLPDLAEVRSLAERLHQKGEEYRGELGGWPVHYGPMHREALPGSSLPFTPATFMIGAFPVWAMSIDWENGQDADPLIWIWDDNIVKQ
jgi:hypothetical protein